MEEGRPRRRDDDWRQYEARWVGEGWLTASVTIPLRVRAASSPRPQSGLLNYHQIPGPRSKGQGLMKVFVFTICWVGVAAAGACCSILHKPCRVEEADGGSKQRHHGSSMRFHRTLWPRCTPHGVAKAAHISTGNRIGYVVAKWAVMSGVLF